MKKCLLLLFCFSALRVSAQTVYPTGSPNCVARYDFSGTPGTFQLPDVSGNAHTGTIFNLTPTAGWRGNPNTAMQFNGSSSWVEVAHTPLLAAQQVTLVGLVRFDAFYSGTCQTNSIVAKGFPHRQPGTYGLYVMDQQYDQDCNAFSPTLETTSADIGAATFTPDSLPAPIQPGKWYFTAVSFNGSTVRVYQQLMDSTTGPPTLLAPIQQVSSNGSAIGTNSLDVVMGRTMHQGYPYWLNGALDEVAIFNRGLSNDEIFAIYSYLWNQIPTAVAQVAEPGAGVQTRTGNGLLTLQSTDGRALGNIRVYNVAGQLLASGDYGDTHATVDLSGAPRGLLLVKVARNGSVATLKTSNL